MIRLLNVHSFTFKTFVTEVPRYVVASHRWSDNSEAMYKDIAKKRNKDTTGYQKVEGYVAYIKDNIAAIDWLWIDTCCVNQDSSQEVSAAVNSMFRLYSNAELCIVFLADVVTAQDLVEFARSSWFRRGWTLQELIAPPDIVFLTQNWQVIGHKGDVSHNLSGVTPFTGPPLEMTLARITGIPERILRVGWQGHNIEVEEIFRWMANRVTTKEEDLAYCLFGLLDVSLPVIYGEGKTKATDRLRAELRKSETMAKESLLVELLKSIPLPHKESLFDTKMRPLEAIMKDSSLESTVYFGQRRQAPQSGNPKLKCPTCPRSFNNRSDLDQHRRDSHGSVFPFDCPSCKCTFRSINARNDHRRASHSLTQR